MKLYPSLVLAVDDVLRIGLCAALPVIAGSRSRRAQALGSGSSARPRWSASAGVASIVSDPRRVGFDSVR